MNKKSMKKPAHLKHLAVSQLKSQMPRSDLARLRKITDKQIAEDVKSDPDVAPLLKEWPKAAHVVIPKKKVPISLRIDADVLNFYKQQGHGYLSLMNAILRAYMHSKTSHSHE